MGALVALVILSSVAGTWQIAPAVSPSTSVGAGCGGCGFASLASRAAVVGYEPASAAAASSQAAWVKLPNASASGPGPIYAPSLVDDLAAGFLLLFGGCSARACPLGDTWAYEAGTWTNLSGSLAVAPPARSGASMAYDAASGSVILFGGEGSSGPLGDTWIFHAGAWSEFATARTPAPRFGASLVPLPGASEVGTLLLFGGHGPHKVVYGDSWTFGPGGWTELLAHPSPPARAWAIMAPDPGANVTLLFGGVGTCGRPCGDTWLFSAAGWKELSESAPSPPARSHAGAAYDPTIGGIVMSGGRGDKRQWNDTWLFRSGGWSNASGKISNLAPARVGAAMAYDTGDGYLLQVGGRGLGSARGPVWALQAPLNVRLVPGNVTVAPGSNVVLTATASGGISPYRLTLDFGDGSPMVNASSGSHVYLMPGTYHPIVTATDALGRSSRTLGTVIVAVAPLTVSVTATPASPAPGASVAFSASAHGGEPPYSYLWTRFPEGCSSANAAVLTCTAAQDGSTPVSVRVTDAVGNVAVGNATVSVEIPSVPATTAQPPSATSTLVPASPPNWSLIAAVTAAAVLAAIASALFYQTARIESAASRSRPLCYTPPEWSETPEDFQPTTIPAPLGTALGSTQSPLAFAPSIARSPDVSGETEHR